MEYLEIITQFKIRGNPVISHPYGEGHINQTFYVETDTGHKYILQRINNILFKDVSALMSNIRLVTEHIRGKLAYAGGDLERGVLTLVYTTADECFLKADAGYFRMYIFIDNATSFQIVPGAAQFYQSAYAFGSFQRMLSDFDASKLYEVLPGFHNTRLRFSNFEQSVKLDKSGRAAAVAREVDFVLARKSYCGKIVDMLSSGAMPLRVTHNDTKLNNVMIDNDSGKALAVIDLDTVMPGSSCYDFGDSIRFGCNPAPEDERDLSKVNFRADLFAEYTKGYLAALGGSITTAEKDNLAFSSILMTYECGMRFLADHIDGDTYFRIRRENQNLDRARTQFKLIEDMERLLPQMEQTVNRY